MPMEHAYMCGRGRGRAPRRAAVAQAAAAALPLDKWACSAAAGGGHLAVLQWLRQQQPPCPWDEWACRAAARAGHLAVLQWLRQQQPPCPWDEEACHYAAEGGHLAMLQWLRQQQPPCPLWHVPLLFCNRVTDPVLLYLGQVGAPLAIDLRVRLQRLERLMTACMALRRRLPVQVPNELICRIARLSAEGSLDAVLERTLSYAAPF